MRRTLITTAIFLLAGAVVNVAVAWGCAAWMNPPQLRSRSLTDDERMTWVEEAPLDYPSAPGRVDSSTAFCLSWKYMRAYQQAADRPVRLYFRLEKKAGWPLLASCGTVWGVQSSDGNRADKTVGLNVPVSHVPFSSSTASHRLVPIVPLWRGTTVNTLFYAALLWPPICGPFVLRRLIRMKRRRCVKCGYPLGGSPVCTECGKPLPKRAVTV